MSSRRNLKICDCYKDGTCRSMKERETCKCGGYESKCDFYEYKRCKEIKTTKSIIENVDSSSDIIQELSNDLVIRYCDTLDNQLLLIKQEMDNAGYLTDETLERRIIELANTLYFTGSVQEDLGIKEDTCKMIRQEVYLKARENASGTVADKTAQAELMTQQETIALAIYSRAYKKVKLRMDAGYEMLNSLKKVMNKRITEMELSNSRYINHNEGE